MAKAKRVGILTGGGDVPGLNAAIQQFVWRMEDEGYEVQGLRRGWAALLHVKPFHDADNSSWLVPLTKASTRTIDRSGGTILHTSRINPSLVKPDAVPEHLRSRANKVLPDGRLDLTDAVLEVLRYLNLDTLVAIGGDGTLSFARRLHKEGVKIVGLPKTMDNDVFGTDYCIGFSTAITRSVTFINDLRTVAGSHERFLVVELFGRYSGETCLVSSYLAGTDRALIAEVPFDVERAVAMMAEDKRTNPSNYAVCAVSEGAYPAGGKPFETGEADAVGNRELGGVGRYLREALQKETGDRVIYQRLGYLMRSGPPDSLDRLVAKNFASLAADLILAGETGRLVAIQNGRYTTEPLDIVGEGKKRVNVERFYDAERYRPNIIGVMGLPMFLC
ncbi:MAG TPA: 6-phosphofructokinase [Thermoanaerobaculia bacterium]|nr:6-phosphofructokinase [Thermoanaerobaculia bacterium]